MEARFISTGEFGAHTNFKLRRTPWQAQDTVHHRKVYPHNSPSVESIKSEFKLTLCLEFWDIIVVQGMPFTSLRELMSGLSRIGTKGFAKQEMFFCLQAFLLWQMGFCGKGGFLPTAYYKARSRHRIIKTSGQRLH